MKAIANLIVFLMGSLEPAQAHTLIPAWPSMSEGVLHPLLGLDHCLALMGLGLWSQQPHLRFPAFFFIPLMMASMAFGGLLGHLAPQWPGVDHLIAASVFVIGALLTGFLPGHRLLALFAGSSFLLVHGYAHGMELPLAANGLSYGLGFLLMSSLLMGIGRGLGHLIQQKPILQTLVGVGLMGAGSFWLLSLR